MEQRPFQGRSIGEMGFGAWAIGGGARLGYGDTDDDQSRAAIRRALACGATFFDTADVYGHGHSETLLAETLPKEVFVASKVGYEIVGDRIQQNFSPDYLRRAVEASLGRLRRDALDLVQLHNPPLAVVQEEGAVEALRRSGMARHVGVSIQTPEEALAAVEAGVDSIQLVFNYLKPEMGDTVLPRAAKAGVAIIVREPLQRGLLTGKFRADTHFPSNDVRTRYSKEEWRRMIGEVDAFVSLLARGVTPARAALKFVLARPEVTVVIPGAKTPEQVEENCSASDGRVALAGDVFNEQAIEKEPGGEA